MDRSASHKFNANVLQILISNERPDFKTHMCSRLPVIVVGLAIEADELHLSEWTNNFTNDWRISYDERRSRPEQNGYRSTLMWLIDHHVRTSNLLSPAEPH